LVDYKNIVNNQLSFPKEARENLIGLLESIKKISNIFNWIIGVNIIAGLALVIGASVAACFVDQQIEEDNIKGAYQDEAYRTTRGYIIKGLINMIPVGGLLINYALDCSYDEWRNPNNKEPRLFMPNF
jgi:hypothetical protein